MKTPFHPVLLAALLVSLIPAAQATQFEECMLDSYDACPNNLLWSCRRHHIYGRDFATKDWFGYPLGSFKSASGAREELEKLIREGVCPGKDGPGQPTSIDPKYREAAGKEARRLGRKLRRLL